MGKILSTNPAHVQVAVVRDQEAAARVGEMMERVAIALEAIVGGIKITMPGTGPTCRADELPPLVNKRERNLEIFRLVDAGNTVKSVAARYELSLTQVYTIVRETGESASGRYR